MWASVFIDGSSVGVYIGRISNVAAGVNGAITANTAGTGTKPANQTATATINVGGALLGPNAASGFPLTLASFGVNQDATGHAVRLNLKNDQTYTMTASFACASGGIAYVVQGYSSTTGDGGKATFDGTTSTGAIISSSGLNGSLWADIIFKTSITTGTTDLFVSGNVVTMVRCVFTGARNNGLNLSVAASIGIELEAYDNNKANTAVKAGIRLLGSNLYRCISHDNAGSNSSGILIVGGPSCIQNCIVDTNGQYGISMTGSASNGIVQIQNTDIYNNGSDGINIATALTPPLWIENCNLIKNTGAGINNVSVINSGFIYNCGYGAGTQANGSSDTINNLTQSGTITYASNVQPWEDAANGDFRINLPSANFAGRASFTETAPSYSGTAGYPDIGAAQSLTGPGGTFSKESSYGFA